VQLTKPEVSFELRAWSEFDTPGFQTLGVASGVGFLSFVYPWKDWSFAVYRHQLANFEVFLRVSRLGDIFQPGRVSSSFSELEM
jgi:hypothetical protein